MTSKPPQILPLTIFQAMGEHTLQLAGNLLHKQLCRDRSCLNAGLFHNWEGNISLRTPVLHISQKRSTGSKPKQRERITRTVMFSFENSGGTTQRITLGRAFGLQNLCLSFNSLCLSPYTHRGDILTSNEGRSHKEWETFVWTH